MRAISLILALAAAPAFAQQMAVLQGQRQVTTISGMVVWECTYAVGSQRFTTLMPQGQMCAPTMQVR